MYFSDRRDAGKQLATVLEKYKGDSQALVLAIPRGGVPVGEEIAKALGLPLDIIVTKKISAPGNPEFAIGSVDIEGNVVLDDNVLAKLGISPEGLEEEIEKLKKNIQEKLQHLRGEKDGLDVKNKTIILVDDGIATGNTLRAAIHTLRRWGAKEIILAAPVAAEDAAHDLSEIVDQLNILYTPVLFNAVGQFYDDFDQTSDDEVVEILKSC